jgi:hypothetical protein
LVSKIEFNGNRRLANQHQKCAGAVPSGAYRPQLIPQPPRELGPIFAGATRTDLETGRRLAGADRPAPWTAARGRTHGRPFPDSAKGYPNRYPLFCRLKQSCTPSAVGCRPRPLRGPHGRLACEPFHDFWRPGSELDAGRTRPYRGRDRFCVALRSIGGKRLSGQS